MSIDKRALGVLAFSASALVTQSAMAAQWDFQQKLRFKLEGTDNVFLTADNPEASGLFAITPILSASTKSKTSTLFVEAAVDLETYSNPETSLVRPSFFAGINSELVPRTLTVDSSVRVRRSSLDEDFRLRDFPNPDDDLVYVAEYRLRPQLSFAFEEFATLDMDLRLKHEDFMADMARDESDGFFFGELRHTPNNTGVYWALTGTAIGGDASDETDYLTLIAEATVGYAFQNSWLATVSAGRERFDDNRIVNSRLLSSDAEDDIWRVGVQWTPNERTEFNAGFGHRVFGEFPYMSLTRFTRNGEFTLSWERELAQAIGEDVGSLTDALTGEVVSSAPGSGLANEQRPSGVFVESVFRLNYRLRGRLSEFVLGISYSAEEDEDSFVTGNRFRLNSGYTRRISERSRLGINLSTEDESNSVGAGEYLRNRVAVFLETRF